VTVTPWSSGVRLVMELPNRYSTPFRAAWSCRIVISSPVQLLQQRRGRRHTGAERVAVASTARAVVVDGRDDRELQSDVLHSVAGRVGVSPQQVALAWLLQRSSTSVVIPGTSSRTHLRENIAAADLTLPADAIAELDAIGTPA
jgi:aryl-alcohol dehydrogenase-like predicted oxidoreductase